MSKLTVSKTGQHHRMLIFPHTIHSLYEPEKKYHKFTNPILNILFFLLVLEIMFLMFFIFTNSISNVLYVYSFTISTFNVLYFYKVFNVLLLDKAWQILF